MTNPRATITMYTGRKIVIELFPQYARNTVCCVIDAIQNHAYDGQIFHRVVKDFVIQTVAREDYYIERECGQGGPEIPPSFTRGVVGMGSDRDYSSGTSFFIMTGDAPKLDGDFAVIGQVIEGLDEVMRINDVPCDGTLYMGKIPFYRPLSDETMVSVTVDTFGVPYEKPVKADREAPHV